MRGPSGQAGCSVVALVAGLVLVATAGHGAVVGVRRDPFTGAPRQGDPVWLRLHQGLAARAATLGHTEVAFYGDSITEVRWCTFPWLLLSIPPSPSQWA